MKLSDMVLNDMIDKRDIKGLLHLYDLNGIPDKQKIIIRNKFLTDPQIIIDAVENNKEELEKFKYGMEVSILYKHIVDIDSHMDYNINKEFDKMPNFGESDFAFLLFLLYYNLEISNRIFNRRSATIRDYRRFIINCYNLTDNFDKVVGVLRIKEFFNVDKLGHGEDYEIYFDLWEIPFLTDINYSYDDENDKKLVFKYSAESPGYKKYFKLWDDNKFNIYILVHIHNNVQLSLDIDCSILEHENKYYLGEYKKIYRIIHDYPRDIHISDKLKMENPYISMASRNLNDITPFMFDGAEEEGDHYKGVIENGEYKREYIHEEEHSGDFESKNVTRIYEEIKELVDDFDKE